MLNVLPRLVMAPLQRWSQTSMIHKVLMAGAGAGAAYYMHKRGAADATIAAAGVGAAYGASMLMHAPTIVGTPMQPTAPLPALPPAQANGMVEQGQAALGVARPRVRTPAARAPGPFNAPAQGQAPPDPSSPWAGLG